MIPLSPSSHIHTLTHSLTHTLSHSLSHVQVLLRNVLLVSLVECLALGWVSVCAGSAIVPSLLHALVLWAVAVLTSAVLDASR